MIPLLFIIDNFYYCLSKSLVLYPRNLVFFTMTTKMTFFNGLQVQIATQLTKNSIQCKSRQINIAGKTKW